MAVVFLSTPLAHPQDAKQHTYESFEIANNAYMDFKRIEPGTFIPGHQTDPLNRLGDLVVGRGGDWFHAHGVDSETRRAYGDDGGLSFLGFRLVREIRE